MRNIIIGDSLVIIGKLMCDTAEVAVELEATVVNNICKWRFGRVYIVFFE
jgi:hypothetical protein